ncbi:MAG: putative ABC transporter permease, partial [Clostridiales Family XIII bacterium]|nr:putative ABC transporter permease [Clostridiales Family XIII bacterium]
YAGGWLLWETRRLRYWDYSDYFLNLHGYICLESMLNFAIMGTMGIYIAAPIFDSMLNRVPLRTRKVVCAVLYSVFSIDVVCGSVWPRSGKGITHEL